jgi:indolepyruvate ferredoxin oxidoreductase
MVDQQMWKAQALLKDAGVEFLPAINEDLAATACLGTQRVALDPRRTVDGVFAMWYGKGPGVDRSGDPIKHGNRQGTSPHGGVLVVFGDDHPGKSSTVAFQSEQALAANGVPVLYPASSASTRRSRRPAPWTSIPRACGSSSRPTRRHRRKACTHASCSTRSATTSG